MKSLLDLTKPRITQLVLVTAAAGFYLGARDHVNLLLLTNTLLGTALVAGGTNAWNQIRERDVDARMARTRRRPLPSGRLSTPSAAKPSPSTISPRHSDQSAKPAQKTMPVVIKTR